MGLYCFQQRFACMDGQRTRCEDPVIRSISGFFKDIDGRNFRLLWSFSHSPLLGKCDVKAACGVGAFKVQKIYYPMCRFGVPGCGGGAGTLKAGVDRIKTHK